MLFSVIIPVRNRPEPLRRCLAGLRAGTLPENQYEIIVVNNASTDSTPQVAARFTGVHILLEPVPNRCRARNLGAAGARGDWLVFIDSDCVPDPDWLANLAAAVQALPAGDKTGLLAGKIRPAPPQTPVEAFIARRRWIDQEKFLAPGRRFSPPFAATANLAVRRELYLALDGLDPDLATAGEDADLCWRAAAEGSPIRYVPSAVVTHYHRSTLSGLWRQSYHYGIGQAELFVKWRLLWGARVWFEPRLYVWALKGLLKSPFRYVLVRDPIERREPFYDFLANLGLIAGRLRVAIRRRALIL